MARNHQEPALNGIERKTLKDCESRIERGLKTFHDVGTALLQIKNDRLYRAEHKTFEDYCNARWSIERRRAYQFIEAAQVVENVQNFTQTQPKLTESAARELGRLSAEKQAEAFKEATEKHGEKPTAAQVREVVQRRMNHAAECESEPTIEGSRCVAVGQRDDDDVELDESELDDDDDADACDPANDLGTLVETTRDAWLEFLVEHPHLKAAVLNRFDLFLDELKEWSQD